MRPFGAAAPGAAVGALELAAPPPAAAVAVIAAAAAAAPAVATPEQDDAGGVGDDGGDAWLAAGAADVAERSPQLPLGVYVVVAAAAGVSSFWQ